jgi:hypothetical protein
MRPRVKAQEGRRSAIAEQYLARRVSKMRTSHQIAGVIRRDLISRSDRRRLWKSQTDVINMLEDIRRQGQVRRPSGLTRPCSICLCGREDPRTNLRHLGEPDGG